MIKSILSGSFPFDDNIASIVPLHKRGVDSEWLTKRAAAPMFDFDNVPSRKGETLVHLLALGDGETIGCNRNGDYFPKKANEDYHGTFLKAHYFHNHDNKDPAKSFGRVVSAAYNPRMGRVELIVGLDNEKAASDLQDLETKGEFPVSMSCFEDASTPVLTARGYVPISSVMRGDWVPTHTGQWRQVTELNKRLYTGEMIDFKVKGMARTFSVTDAHPFYMMRQKVWAKAVKGSGRNDDVDVGTAPDWGHAGCLEHRDKIMGVVPQSAPPGVAVLDDTSLSLLLGYYIAEGSLRYNRDKQTGERKKACTTAFTVHIDDAAFTRIPQIMNDLWPDVSVTFTPHCLSDVCAVVDVHSTRLSEFILNNIGAGALTKKIPPMLFGASRDVKLAFLGGWLDGDGWVDKKGAHWSSVNEGIALAGRDLLASLGIGASVYKIDRSKQPGAKNVGLEYTLNIALLDIDPLSPWSQKVTQNELTVIETNKPCSWRALGHELAACSIKEISKRQVAGVYVYNIEVEEDHSYSAAGLVSHNCRVPHDTCSICGNKAKSRKEYCKHASLQMGKIMEDGKQACVINDHPNFFDISKVYRGADRVAFTFRKLEKAAADGHVVGGAELAELLEISELTVPIIRSANPRAKEAVWNRMSKVADGRFSSFSAATQCEDLTLDQVRMFKSADDIGPVLGALHRAGICLPLDSFLSIMRIEKPAGVKTSDIRKRIRGLLIAGTGDSAKKLSENGSYDGTSAPITAKAANLIASIRRTHGLHPQDAYPRIVEKTAQVGLADQPIEKIASEVSPQVDNIASEYSAYLLSLATENASFDHVEFVQNLTALHALG